jgi:histidine triad (HIT) family protein
MLVIPNRHIENMYTLPAELAMHIHETARQVALAMKQAFACEGVSTRQHNEPAGNQHVRHYHLHVFPRFTGDKLYLLPREFRLTTPLEHQPYAERLRTAMLPAELT